MGPRQPFSGLLWPTTFSPSLFSRSQGPSSISVSPRSWQLSVSLLLKAPFTELGMGQRQFPPPSKSLQLVLPRTSVPRTWVPSLSWRHPACASFHRNGVPLSRAVSEMAPPARLRGSRRAGKATDDRLLLLGWSPVPGQPLRPSGRVSCAPAAPRSGSTEAHGPGASPEPSVPPHGPAFPQQLTREQAALREGGNGPGLSVDSGRFFRPPHN